MATDSKGRSQRRGRRHIDTEQVEIDSLMLADWAEAINGKLYIQGAGWDRKVLNADRVADFSIVASFVVPWNLTNRQHEFAMTILDEDGNSVAPALTGTFTVGRPPNARPGQRFRSPIAVRCGIKLPGLGSYRVSMSLNQTITSSVAFDVVEAL